MTHFVGLKLICQAISQRSNADRSLWSSCLSASLSFSFPCRIGFARPEDIIETQFPFLDQNQEFDIFSNGCLDLSANHLISNMVLLRNVP